MRILIIEPDMDLKEIIREYLSGFRTDTCVVDTETEVIRSLTVQAPSVVFLAHSIYLDEYTKHILHLITKYAPVMPYIVIMTTSVQRTRERGFIADEIVEKPFSLGLFGQVVKRVKGCYNWGINESTKQEDGNRPKHSADDVRGEGPEDGLELN